MADMELTIGKDYSATPGGRYIDHGGFSGEDFRENVLIPALKANPHLTVYLDGTAGYAGSFLEEAFGGLVRSKKFTPAEIETKLTVAVRNARYEIYRRMVLQYLKDAVDGSNSTRVA